MINQRNKYGRRQGLWERYYLDGKLNYRGRYNNGHEHGLWEEYHPNGGLLYKGAFKRGNPVGLCYTNAKR